MTAPTPRHARARTSMPAETVALGWLLIAIVVLAALVAAAIALAAAARAASDDTTPYSVTRAGIAFPEPLAAHGHVNVRLVDGRTAGLHLDPSSGQPWAAWIGATFLPWSALGIADGCVAWVQWSGADEHFGEGGQPPVCLDDDTETTPCPDPTSTTKPTSSPSPRPSTSSTPSPTPSPETSPTQYPTARPSSTPRPSAGPTSSPTSAPSPTSTSAAPSAAPSPAPTVSLAAPPAAPTPTLSPTPLSVPTDLAATGIDLGLAIFIIVVVLVGGVIAIGISGIERGHRGEDR